MERDTIYLNPQLLYWWHSSISITTLLSALIKLTSGGMGISREKDLNLNSNADALGAFIFAQ